MYFEYLTCTYVHTPRDVPPTNHIRQDAVLDELRRKTEKTDWEIGAHRALRHVACSMPLTAAPSLNVLYIRRQSSRPRA